jgi:hypothetical protein
MDWFVPRGDNDWQIQRKSRLTVWCILCEEWTQDAAFCRVTKQGLLSESMRAETPRTSERRMNSWWMGLHILPMQVRKSMVLIHSSVVMLRVRRDEEMGKGLA